MSESGFYQVCHRSKPSAQNVTLKAEEKSITDGSYISPPGHLATIKNLNQNESEVSFNLVSMGGV